MREQPLEIEQVPQFLFTLLRTMEAEADEEVYKPERDGKFRPGLCNFAWYYRPQSNQWEDVCRDRLCELIESRGIPVELTPPYSDGRKGDLRIQLTTGEFLFIEMKGVWRYRTYSPTPLSNGVYHKHLTSPTEGVAKDFLKIDAAIAKYLGILVLGFDAPGYNLVIDDAHVQEMKRNGRYADHHWKEYYDQWEGRDVLTARARIWFWWRQNARNY